MYPDVVNTLYIFNKKLFLLLLLCNQCKFVFTVKKNQVFVCHSILLVTIGIEPTAIVPWCGNLYLFRL